MARRKKPPTQLARANCAKVQAFAPEIGDSARDVARHMEAVKSTPDPIVTGKANTQINRVSFRDCGDRILMEFPQIELNVFFNPRDFRRFLESGNQILERNRLKHKDLA